MKSFAWNQVHIEVPTLTNDEQTETSQDIGLQLNAKMTSYFNAPLTLIAQVIEF